MPPVTTRAVAAGPVDTGAVRYDPTIYLGSAAHYRHGRPAYSPELEAVLTQEASLDGNGRLLDAGCGPGILGSTRRAGQGTAPERTHRFEDVLARTRFGVPQQFFVPGIPDLLRDSESVLSGYLSLSSSAPHLFGDRLDDFAGEVRALLASRSAEGIFWDWPGDTEVVMARKPG